MSALENPGILGWEADHVPIASIGVDVHVHIDEDYDDSNVINPSIPGAYVTRVVRSADDTLSYSFLRETWTPDTIATAQKFQIVAGMSDITPSFRQACAELIQNQPSLVTGGVYAIGRGNVFSDNSKTVSLTTTTTYTQVGPNPPDPFMPSNTTVTAPVACSFYMTLQSDTSPLWAVTASCASAELPGTSGNGPDIKRHNLKTVAGDAVNFGTTLHYDTPAIIGYQINAWDVYMNAIIQVV